jgi:hypothetical protein
MLSIRKIITCCFLLSVSHYFLNTAAAQSFYTETQTLHSAINGKGIAKLTFSLESKTNQYVLTITNAQSSSDTEIWIFPKATNADKIKSLHSSLEAKGINNIHPFCSGNKVNVPISETKNIRYQEKLTLAGALSAGETVTLEMNFYIATKTKKKSIVNDHAKARITFTLPAGSGKNNNVIEGGEGVTTLLTDTDFSAPVVEPTPEEVETQQQRKADSTLQIQIAELDLFINKKNIAIEALLAEINELEAKNKKIEEAKEPVNWGMYIGIAVGVLMIAGMFAMQIWNQIKVKRQQRRQQEEMNKEMRRREFETLDQNLEDI